MSWDIGTDVTCQQWIALPRILLSVQFGIFNLLSVEDSFRPNFRQVFLSSSLNNILVYCISSIYRSWHLFPSHFGTYLCCYCSDQFSRTCRVFSRLFTFNIPRYFADCPLIYHAILRCHSFFKSLRFCHRYDSY